MPANQQAAVQPRFGRAVVADAKLLAARRNERSSFSNRLDAAAQVVRLMWRTDVFFAQTMSRAKVRMRSLGVPFLPKLADRLAIAGGHVSIGDRVVMHPGVVIAHGMVRIEGTTEILPGVTIMSDVTIEPNESGDGPTIGPDVHIGTGATVRGPVRVQRGARIGANAVVVDNVREGDRVVGAPARSTRVQTPATAPPYLFVHVMRTGGFGLLQQIRANFAADEVYPDRALDVANLDAVSHTSLEYIARLPDDRRTRIRVYAGHLPFTARDLFDRRPIIFTVLRDPVERTISLLRVFKDRRPEFAEKSLDEIYDDPTVFLPLVKNHQTKMFAATPRDNVSSVLDVVEIDEARLVRAEANLAEVDVVGLYERYGDFLGELRDRFGWRLDQRARANAALGSYEISSTLRERIARDNAIDMQFYEYARELVAGRARA